MQTPATHEVLPFGLVHARPQAPQFETLTRFASHPLAVMASQLPQPDKQLTTHVPAGHDGVAWLELHTFEHAPQFVGE